MTKPNYIVRGGEQVFSPPYVASGVQFFGFAVEAGSTALQSICDRYLNAPTGSQDFLPIGNYVMFVFNKIDKMYAKDPPDNLRGWYSEQEAAVWMPVWDQKRNLALWHHPYMVVDSSYAMAMGREIYGFPKEMGWFEFHDGPNPPPRLLVETVVAELLATTTQATRKRLFEARPANSMTTQAREEVVVVSSIEQLMATAILTLGLDKTIAKEQLAALTSSPVPFVFLKLIRDAVEAGRVCFRSTQEAICKITNLIELPRIFMTPYEIAYDEWGSHQLRAELGLPPGSAPASFAFWTKFDFEIGFCQEISRYPATS